MFDFSIETANSIHTAASIIAVTAALVAACAGGITYITSTIQSQHNNLEIAKANSLSDQANNAAAQAKLKTEELTKQNLELAIKLENEKQNRLKIESTLGMRYISEQQANEIIKALSSKNEEIEISIQIARQESEVLNYGRQIAEAFKRAGAHVSISNTIIMSGDNTGTRALIMKGPGHIIIHDAIKASGIANSIDILEPQPGTGYLVDPNKFAASITVFPKSLHL